MAVSTALVATGAAAQPEALGTANSELNAIYAKVMAAQSTKSDKDALRSVERAWIAYRDRQCDFESGTPPSGPMRTDCELRLTKARTDELSHMICPGLGVSACSPH